MNRWMTSLLALAGAVSATGAIAAPSSPVARWRAAHETAIVDQLDRLSRIPSVAADPAGLNRMAETLAGELRARGFDTRLLETGPGAPPNLFARLDTPGARRTVVFYAHYDGQPVKPSQWTSDPFVPVMRERGPDGTKDVDWRKAAPPYDREWRFHGRAVADDKASIVAFLAAFDALKAVGRKPSVNLRIFWEGEEEAGSPHLAETLRTHADLLKADLWLIGDGPVHQSRRPTIYFGARGTLGLEATIYGPASPLHDGHYGNWVPNPAAMAAQLIAQMRDEQGRILIPGLADGVRPLTPAEQKAIAALPPVEADLAKTFAIGGPEGSEGLTASTMRPSLNIRGLSAGGTGATATNAIPAEAAISIDFRLVPDQSVEQVRGSVEAFLKARGWTVVHEAPDLATRRAHARIIRLDWEGGYPGLRTDMNLPVSRAVLAAAERATGQPVLALPMMGGSVPLHIFETALHTPLIGLPIANHDNSQHAPNENLRLGNLWDGIDLYAGMIGGLDW